MPTTYKRLVAINPSANTQTNVYVVPAATEAVISTITICNQSFANALYSLAVMPSSIFTTPAGAAHFIARDVVLPASDTVILTMGLTANTGTVITANASIATVSFSAFGSEIT